MRYLENTTKTRTAKRAVAMIGLSLSLVIGLAGTFSISANAQGLGLDQDAVLPPEVIPFEAAPSKTGSSPMTASETQAPEFSTSQAMLDAMPPAQKFRYSAYQELMKQSQGASNQNQMQGQLANNQAPAQPLNMSSQPMLQQSQWLSAGGITPAPMQSQTMTGGARNTTPQSGTTKKLRNGISKTTMVGTSLMSGAMMLRRNPASAVFGLGTMGVSLARFGMSSMRSR